MADGAIWMELDRKGNPRRTRRDPWPDSLGRNGRKPARYVSRGRQPAGPVLHELLEHLRLDVGEVVVRNGIDGTRGHSRLDVLARPRERAGGPASAPARS